jgi:formylglycine-generating enzyme required for sulfatase activity
MPGVRRWSCPWVLACCAAPGLAGAVLAGSSQAAPPRYHETIPGTLVRFEMQQVPAQADAPAFFVGRTEVTWDMYDVFALGLDTSAATGAADAIARPSNPYGAPDRGWGHAGFPAMSITRAAAEAFCQWLSAKTGKAYRLPTDAEWSRAAALATAGGTPAVASLDPIAWHRGNAEGRTHPVATRAADASGLFDLFGNTAEWVTTTDGALVTRGGSYRDAAEALGPAARAVQDASWNDTDPQLPKSRWWLSDGPFVGFRLAATIPAGATTHDTGEQR